MSNALPPFDANGNLPAGDYHPSQQDFEERFVTVFGSVTREAIYGGYRRHREALSAEGVAGSAACLLDGSFTTSKKDPGDLDLVVEVDAHGFQAKPAVQALLSGRGAKALYKCDAYPLPVLPAGDPHYAVVTERARDYWRKWFGTDRAGNAKGLVWSTIGGFR